MLRASETAERPEPAEAEFDAFAAGYSGGMDNSLKQLAGDDADVFIELKVEWLLRDLRRRPVTVGPEQAPRLLDFGCGAGLLLRILRRLGFQGELHGCDVSSGMLAEAARCWAEGTLPELVHYNGKALPYDDHTVEVVVACGVFHHIPPDERRQAYHEITRVLAPTGRVYVFEHNPWNPVTRWVVSHTPIDEGAVLLSPPEVLRSTRASGLPYAGVEHLMFFPPRWRWARRLENGLRWLPFGGQYVVWAEPQACLPPEITNYP